MVAARSAAMGFNRLVDAAYDARNPRTAMREIPAGRDVAARGLGCSSSCGRSRSSGAAAMLGRWPLAAVAASRW